MDIVRLKLSLLSGLVLTARRLSYVLHQNRILPAELTTSSACSRLQLFPRYSYHLRHSRIPTIELLKYKRKGSIGRPAKIYTREYMAEQEMGHYGTCGGCGWSFVAHAI